MASLPCGTVLSLATWASRQVEPFPGINFDRNGLQTLSEWMAEMFITLDFYPLWEFLNLGCLSIVDGGGGVCMCVFTGL